MHKYTRLLGLFAMTFLSACSSVPVNTAAEPTANNQGSKQLEVSSKEISDFVQRYNRYQESKNSEDRQYLKLTSINEKEQLWYALECWQPSCATLGDKSGEYYDKILSPNMFKLFKADINNDGQDDYTLAAMDDGHGSDVVIGVYKYAGDTLTAQPYYEAIIDLVGTEGLKQWHTYLGSPFITFEQAHYVFNFIDPPVYRNQHGEQVYSPQNTKADYRETAYHKYVWSEGKLRLLETTLNKQDLSEGP